MKITRITLAQDELPLVSTAAHGARRDETRPVLLVALWDDRGRVAIGEAAPLPEHGTESFDIAFDVLYAGCCADGLS